MTATLYRAVAYRLQRFDTPEYLQQPEVHVFVQAPDHAAAAATLLRSLALVWRCEPADLEFYNLVSEAELLGPEGPGMAEIGDAGLLCSGWFNGPLFCRADRTLMLVCPRALARLHQARHQAQPWARRQREASLLAAGATRGEAAARAQHIRDMLAADADLDTLPMPGPTTVGWVNARAATSATANTSKQ